MNSTDCKHDVPVGAIYGFDCKFTLELIIEQTFRPVDLSKQLETLFLDASSKQHEIGQLRAQQSYMRVQMAKMASMMKHLEAKKRSLFRLILS